MNTVRERFGDVFASLGGLEPLFGEFKPLTFEELAEIEEELGVRLPVLYRKFLLEIGGVFLFGIVVRMIQKSPGGGPENRETIDCLFGAKTQKHKALSRNIKFWKDRLSDKVIAIGDDLMGNLTCLAIKGKTRGMVYFWDHDYGKLYLAASAFEDFLRRLEVYK